MKLMSTIIVTVIPLSIRTEKNNYFFLCPKTKENCFHTVRKLREWLMPIICQKVSVYHELPSCKDPEEGF